MTTNHHTLNRKRVVCFFLRPIARLVGVPLPLVSQQPQQREHTDDVLKAFFATLGRHTKIAFGAEYTGPPFKLFSRLHVKMLSFLALEQGLVQAFFVWQRGTQAKKLFRYGFGTVLFLDVLLWNMWQVSIGQWNLANALPLHICTASMVLCGVLLFTKSYVLYEVCYFWSIGALQAVLTPPMSYYNFPHYFFFRNFVSHNSIMVTVLYMTFVEHYRPYWRSVGRVIAITTMCMAGAGIVNVLTHGNYMFIARKPDFPTPIDYFGPWPWYIIPMYASGVTLFVLFYLPFALHDWRTGGEGRKKCGYVSIL